ncbi:MAG: tRNA pseudouridine(38-40) synthase TruA, partial [Pyrinomonadaceae bacterium]
PNLPTIQGVIQDRLKIILRGDVKLTAASRTDAGVHAISQVAHLKVSKASETLKPLQIQFAFNDLLPHDINILKVQNAPENFHARHDAISRYYLYQIATRRTAFGKDFVWWVKDKLDVERMKKASSLIVGVHDFRAFCDIEKNQSTIVRVERSEVFIDGSLICFRIGASHFLWKMVRRLVGTLVEVGRKNITVEEFAKILNTNSRHIKEFTAPPSGLFLEKVIYKDDEPPKEFKAVFPV